MSTLDGSAATRRPRPRRPSCTRPPGRCCAGRCCAHGPDADAFRLVRRHAGELRDWFDRNTGWRLRRRQRGRPAGQDVPDTDDATHPARDAAQPGRRSRRRRYVLLCLALAVLERADAQITLGRLAEQIVLAAADPRLAAAGVDVHPGAAARSAATWSPSCGCCSTSGCCARVAGDEDAFVAAAATRSTTSSGACWPRCSARPRGPSTIAAERLRASGSPQLTAERRPTTDELRNRAIRRRLTRRLLDDPVLYYDELTEAELAYLTRQRARDHRAGSPS